MTQSNQITLECPQCNTQVIWDESFPHRPFCSKRCKLIDFGQWATEQHRIEGSSLYDDIQSEDLENPIIPR